MADLYQGIDMKQASSVLDQAKEFFALPKEKKMQVCTDLIPEEFCGYHPMEHYNINKSARRGKPFSKSLLNYTDVCRSARSLQLELCCIKRPRLPR